MHTGWYAHTWVRACVRACVCVCVRTCLRKYVSTCVHAFVRACVRSCVHTCRIDIESLVLRRRTYWTEQGGRIILITIPAMPDDGET